MCVDYISQFLQAFLQLIQLNITSALTWQHCLHIDFRVASFFHTIHLSTGPVLIVHSNVHISHTERLNSAEFVFLGKENKILSRAIFLSAALKDHSSRNISKCGWHFNVCMESLCMRNEWWRRRNWKTNRKRVCTCCEEDMGQSNKNTRQDRLIYLERVTFFLQMDARRWRSEYGDCCRFFDTTFYLLHTRQLYFTPILCSSTCIKHELLNAWKISSHLIILITSLSH